MIYESMNITHSRMEKDEDDKTDDEDVRFKTINKIREESRVKFNHISIKRTIIYLETFLAWYT